MVKHRQIEVEDAPEGLPAWMTTFCDCMTLLLCFFVLLLTFSSFEKVALQNLAGAFATMNYNTLFAGRLDPMDSMIKPVAREEDHTDKGSEKPTDAPKEAIKRPRTRREILNSDAFRSHRTFYIPSGELFWGGGTNLRDDADKVLKLMARLLKLLPACHVVLGESQSLTPGQATDGSLARTWQLMSYFTEGAGLPVSRFSISATDSGAARRFSGKPVVEITLLARRIGE